MANSGPVKTQTIAVALGIWLSAAAIAITLGALDHVPPPLVLVGLAVLITFLAFFVPGLRSWVRTVDLRVLLLPHLVRFVGLAFLVLVNRGVLDPAFVPIGWGDFASAVGAVALLIIGAPATDRPRRLWFWLAWNTFGVADMVLLVATAVPVGLSAPEQFELFRQLPFGLLPTFAVPLIIASHVLIFSRLLTQRSRPAA